MKYNQTPVPPQPVAEAENLVGIASTDLFGMPLSKCEDVEKLRSASEKLWSIIDDIDTACDMFKPSDEAGYRKFYDYTMRRVGERQAILSSDGYDLFLPAMSKCEWAEHPADDEDRLIREDGSDDAHIIAHGKLMDQMVAEGGTCPQCGEPIIQPRDSEMYCENCGWPDENREDDVSEWPCQQSQGGKDAAVMDLDDSGGMCHHPECNPKNFSGPVTYCDGTWVKIGDKVTINEAACTVIRFIHSRGGQPYMVVCKIHGVALEHGVFASRFRDLLPSLPNKTCEATQGKEHE
jgi:hypothetical protein